MSSTLIALSNAVTRVTLNTLSSSIEFSNPLYSNIANIRIMSAPVTSTNSFDRVVTFEPTSGQMRFMNFQASDLLLYEWHTVIARRDCNLYTSSRGYLNTTGRHMWFHLRRNVRNTRDYFAVNQFLPNYWGDSGSYDPWEIISGMRPVAIINYSESGHLGGDFSGQKTELGFDVVCRFDGGDYNNGENQYLVLYPGMSFSSSQSIREGSDNQDNTNNNAWPLGRDTRLTSTMDQLTYTAAYT